jgi:hypothetical protein
VASEREAAAVRALERIAEISCGSTSLLTNFKDCVALAEDFEEQLCASCLARRALEILEKIVVIDSYLDKGGHCRCVRCGHIVGTRVSNYPEHPRDVCPFIPDAAWEELKQFKARTGRGWRSIFRVKWNDVYNVVNRRSSPSYRRKAVPRERMSLLEHFKYWMEREPDGVFELYYVHVSWTGLERVRP